MNLGWPELVTVAVTFASVVAVVLLHYEGLSLIGRIIKARAFHHRTKILVLIFAQLGLHIIEIWMFAGAAFVLTQAPEFGAVLPASVGVPVGGFLDFVYFSAITYTTVGFGDFVPAGPVRFLAGMEALTGFVLITWSASFTFLEMQRYWGRD
jgi:Ion channel